MVYPLFGIAPRILFLVMSVRPIRLQTINQFIMNPEMAIICKRANELQNILAMGLPSAVFLMDCA